MLSGPTVASPYHEAHSKLACSERVMLHFRFQSVCTLSHTALREPRQ